MKFTLKVTIDSASELATLIQDLNMEVDLPFINESGSPILEEFIIDRDRRLSKQSETIESLITKFEELQKQLAIPVSENSEPDHVPDAGETTGEINTSPAYLPEVVKCKLCGNDVVIKSTKSFVAINAIRKTIIGQKKRNPSRNPRTKPLIA